MNVDEEFAVPMDSEHAKKLKDWDIVRTGGPDSIITKTLSCCFGEKVTFCFKPETLKSLTLFLY